MSTYTRVFTRPTAIYTSKQEETYTNPSEIKVRIYFSRIELSNEKSFNSLSNQVEYILSLSLNDAKNRLTFSITHENVNYIGFATIDERGKIYSFRSENFGLQSGENQSQEQIMIGFKSPFSVRFVIKDCRDLKTFVDAKVEVIVQQEENPETTAIMKSINKFLTKAIDDTEVEIYYQTDNLAVNLGEMVAKLTSDHSYPNGFPKELIGYCKNLPTTNTTAIDTFYSFKPKLSKVLKLEGDNLLDQTNKINEKYNDINIDDYKNNCFFFNSILAYTTLRYMFAGLSNNSVFSTQWLYSNNYNKFLRKLKKSEFSAAVPIFTEYQPSLGVDFSDYNKYFRRCVKHT